MNAEQNKQIVSEFFESFCTTDVAGAFEKLDESVSWQAMGRAGELPISGEMDKQAIGRLIETVRQIFPDGIELTPTGWTCEGDRVAVEVESYSVKGNGTVYNNFYHFLLSLADGKITAVREYFDTLHVKQVFIDDK